MVSEQQRKDAAAASKTNSTKDNTTTNDPVVRCSQVQECEISSITIRANGAERSFELTVPGTPNRYDKDYVIQTISQTEKPRVVKIQFRGTCKHGKPSTSALSKQHENNQRPNFSQACPTVKVSGYQINVQQPSETWVQVYPKLEREDDSWLGFVQHYLFPTLTPSIYTVQATKCSGSDGRLKATIEAFPPFSIGGSISVAWIAKSDDKKRLGSFDRGPRFTEKQGFEFKGAIKCKVDGREWKIGYEKESEKSLSRPKQKDDDMFSSFRNALATALGYFDEINEAYDTYKELVLAGEVTTKRNYQVEITKFPSFDINVNSKLIESADKYNVDLESSVTINLTVFEASIEVDILTLIFKRGGPYAKFIQYIRELAEEGVGKGAVKADAKFGLVMELKGKISGELQGKTTLEQGWKTGGKIENTIGIGAKAFAEATATAFFVKVTVGVRAEVKSAETKSELPEIAANLGLEWDSKQGKMQFVGEIASNGLGIYYTYFAKVGSAEVKDEKDGGNGVHGNLKEDVEDDISVSHENESKYVVFEPWKWPKESRSLAKALA